MQTYIGSVKWFDKKKAYGFITTTHRLEENGTVTQIDPEDVFVHVTKIRGDREWYKVTLFTGEYVSFQTEIIDSRKQAIDVTGMFGGKLLCECESGTYRFMRRNRSRRDHTVKDTDTSTAEDGRPLTESAITEWGTEELNDNE